MFLVEITVRVKINTATLGEATWHEYVVRFVFGGTITALAGLTAEKYGPVIGGLLLAFPAIFPASATLIEKHETEEKQEHGMHGTMRGRAEAAVDAAGAAMGTVGLFVFAFVVYRFLEGHSHSLVLMAAILCWLAVSVGIWWMRQRIFGSIRRSRRRAELLVLRHKAPMEVQHRDSRRS